MSNETAVRNHKDSVFSLLYSERENLLSLYNALNDTDYSNPEELEVITLEESICVKMKNDSALVINGRINLYEQQSTFNPNMPLRSLHYISKEYQKIIKGKQLYMRTPISLPAPRFVVLYNGEDEQPERSTLRLSEMFEIRDKNPQLELIVTVYNINKGKNEGLLKKCESLGNYMYFVNGVRERKEGGEGLKNAVLDTVNECIEKGIMADFFRKYKDEVIEMSIWEFDQELHDEAMREDGKVEGKIEEIFNSVQEGDYSVERGAQKLNLSVEQFEEKMMTSGYKIPELI